MTVAISDKRLQATLAFLRHRAERGAPAPTNYEIAKAIGMGKQRFQPHDRFLGIRSRAPEAGAVMIAALEARGDIKVKRGSNRREITLRDTGQVLKPGAPMRGLRNLWLGYDALRAAMEAEGWVSRRQAAQLVGVAPSALRQEKCREQGWRTVKIGRFVFVSVGDALAEREALTSEVPAVRFLDACRAARAGRVRELLPP